MERQLSDLIQKYKNIDDIGVFEENAPVWVCWWTGVEMAPDLVKQCIKSIRKQSSSITLNSAYNIEKAQSDLKLLISNKTRLFILDVNVFILIYSFLMTLTDSIIQYIHDCQLY